MGRKGYPYTPLRFATYKPLHRKMVLTYTAHHTEAPPARPGLAAAEDGVVLSSDADAEMLGKVFSHTSLKVLC
ncbi:uncharacterized protein PG998_006307 [Apiospora kogelbergensis]|uniref:uncharacterized protein n=1 Tax=Apiospora kogelbergensis TaxID=1337665 RepID=UPI003131DC73